MRTLGLLVVLWMARCLIPAPGDGQLDGSTGRLAPEVDAAPQASPSPTPSPSPSGDAALPDARVTDGGADGSSTAARAFGAACSVNADCQSNLCFAFGQGGSACTLPCTAANAATVCPTVNGVNLGCNGMNVCKVR